MAQIDTGLGWSADSAYVAASAGVIGEYHTITPQAPIANQPIPQVAGESELSQMGYNYNNWSNVYTYVTGSLTGFPVYVFYYSPGANQNRFVWVSSVSTAGIVGAAKTSWGTMTQYFETTTRNLDVTSGLYYYELTGSGGAEPQCPQFASFEDGMAYFSVISKDVYKLLPGYAAVCFATWWTPAGAKIHSPVLISTDRDATVISYDGTSVATQTTESFIYDGMVFYMSYDLAGEDGPSTAFPIVDLTQYGAALGSKVFRLLASESYANIQLTTPPPDPYEEQTDPSEEEGGAGDDPEDDPVEEETLPIPAVVGLGFSTIYVPTQTDLYNLAAYLWGGNLDLDNFLKLFANPMDSILGLSAVPLVLSGTYEPIYLGGQQLQGITMPRYTGRTAVKVDMGTATITERWGAYLDYDPYTELAIYVPFVGIKNIKTDDVMGKTIRLMYDIDILSGACIAYIRPEGGSPLYEWSGQCAMQIPITGANWDNIFSTAINTVATLGGALFAPASAPVLGGAVASAASQAIAAKPRIERSGAVNGITGFLGQLRPYIIRSIPEAYIPNEQNKFIGYPSYISVNLGSLTGYNEIASIHLENIPATGDELAELENILKAGVIF